MMIRSLALALVAGFSFPAFAQEAPPPPPAGTAPAAAPAPPAAQQPQPGTPAAPPPIEEKPLEAAPPATPDKPAETPTPERFKQALSPHGQWVQTPEYGEVWVPAGVPGRWRPYSHGRWVYTRHGWTFVSYDPWGWGPFHYGRWVYHPLHRWSWIPGYEWSPAWVTWRYGGGHIGWAPLGPTGVAVSYYDTPSLWIGVRGPYFYRPLVHRYFVPTARWGVVMRTTYFAGVPRVGVYYSPPVKYVSTIVRRPIVRVSAARVAPRWVARGVYRPQVRLRTAFRAARTRVVARPGRALGWRGRGPGWRGRGPGWRGRGPGFRPGVRRGPVPRRLRSPGGGFRPRPSRPPPRRRR
jgi:hypothetical protein